MSPKAIDEARHQRRRENAGTGGNWCHQCRQCHRRWARHHADGHWLCCECHVKAGYQPAEWHPDCMAVAAALRLAKR
jgi:hypothetical protein